MRSLSLTISGMSCGHCLNAVNKALSSLPGVTVRGVQMNRAEVAYDAGLIEAGDVIAGVEAAGYGVEGSSETGESP